MAATLPISASQPTLFFSDLFTDLITAFPCARSADAAFERVYLNKLDETGEPKTYKINDRVTGEPVYTTTLSYIENRTTGDFYLDEPETVVRGKCAALILGIPFYTAGFMAWNVTKTALMTFLTGIDAFKQLGEQLASADIEQGCHLFQRQICTIPSILANGIWTVVSAPIYAVAAELSACVGLVDPYLGREWEAAVEYRWQKRLSYREDFSKIPKRPSETCWEAFMKDLVDARGCYLANCFQVRGNVANREIRVLRREAI